MCIRDRVATCRRCGVQDNKVAQLLLDCKAAQKPLHVQVTREEYSSRKMEKYREKYGGVKFGVKMAIRLRLINDHTTFMTILLTCKDWNSSFGQEILKQNAKLQHKFSIWEAILDKKNVDYEQLKQKTLLDTSTKFLRLKSTVELDVKRSFRKYSDSCQTTIINVLLTYTAMGEIEYCQGMNCIVCLLFLLCKNETSTFNMFRSLILRFNLQRLFKNGMPLLQQRFYQFNRLTAIYLPEVHAHLFEEKITPEYFSSPWSVSYTHLTLPTICSV
eukprot:TRINITY_DN13209_c0_g1_i1.p1 TRINITY_DN13209_c0_g1~~TRINITY_DN13209_c0_g1_i1.p1  ORF type:complete len:273 (-),score=46.78 TRINITY_DN13209_c0_g1_i1:34-852(-)